MRRTLLSIVAANVVLLFSGGLYAQDGPKEIIKKAIAATGGEEKLKKFKGFKDSSEGSISLNGMEIDFESSTIAVPPDKQKTTLKVAIGGMKVTVEQLINGDKVTSKANGKEQEVTDAQKEDIRQQMRMREAAKLVPLLADKEYELKPAEAIKVDGKDAVGVKISRKNLKELIFYFDRKTNLLVKVERSGLAPGTGEAAKQEIFLTDHKEVDGVKRPTKQVIFFDGTKFLESTVVEQRMLEMIDDKEFND